MTDINKQKMVLEKVAYNLELVRHLLEECRNISKEAGIEFSVPDDIVNITTFSIPNDLSSWDDSGCSWDDSGCPD